MINRTCSEQEWLLSLDYVLGADGVNWSDLQKVDAWCSSLDETMQECLAAGEEEEMMALYVEFPHNVELLGIFEDIFEGVPS